MFKKKGTMFWVSTTVIEVFYHVKYIYLNLHSLLAIQKASLLDWLMVKSTVLLKEIETECETANQLVIQTESLLGP